MERGCRRTRICIFSPASRGWPATDVSDIHCSLVHDAYQSKLAHHFPLLTPTIRRHQPKRKSGWHGQLL